MVMGKEAIRDFLQQVYVGVLGINRKNGAPQLVPVWYLYDGEAIWIVSEKEAFKVRNARRDPRVTLCVDDKLPPYKGVVVYGSVKFIEDDTLEMRRAIARRYLGDTLGDAHVGKSRPEEVVLLRLEPERFYSWDYGMGDQS